MKTSSERPTQLRLSVPARPPLPTPTPISSLVRHYPSYPTTPSASKPFPFSPAATPTPSKRPGAKPWLPWLCTLLHLSSLYWLNNSTTSALSLPFTFLALLLAALLTALQHQPPRNRPLTSLQRATLLVDGAMLAMLFFLRFTGCRACGPMEAILAEFAGALAGKALLGKSPDRGKKIRGIVALLTGSFLLSQGWDRAACFPAGAYDTTSTLSCNRVFRLAAPLAAGLMASLEKSCANRSSIRHLGKRRVRLISLSIAAAILFPFAVFKFFLWDTNPGPAAVYASSPAFWAMIGTVGLGVVSSFSGELYSEEKLLMPPLSPKPFFMTVCCLCGLELVFGLELSLLGFLLCSFIMWIAVRDLGSPSGWTAYSILESDPSDAFFSLVKNPLHHILRERKSRKIAIFLLINTAFMVVEFVSGFMSNSLGLISDACHMLFDCAALAIGLYASYISRLPANGRFNYGYGRFEVLSGYVNAVILVLAGSLIVLESLERIMDPQEISTESLLLVSVGGLLVNIVGLVFFHEEHHHAHGGGGCSHSNGTHSRTHSHDAHDHDHHSHSHSHSHTCTIKTVPCSSDHQGFVNSEEIGSNSLNHFHENGDVKKGGKINLGEDHNISHRLTCHSHGQGESHDKKLQGDICNGHSHINQAAQISHEHHQLVVPSHKHDEHGHPCEHDHLIQRDHTQCVHDLLDRKDASMQNEQIKDAYSPYHAGHHQDCKHNHSHGHSHLEHSHSHSHSHLEHSHSHNDSHLEHSQVHRDSHLEHSHSHLGHSHSAEYHRSKEHRHIDHNMEGIFLHVLADTLGSVGVVASTLLIKYKGWLVSDPACSIFISFLIISSVIPLLRNAAEILLQRVPRANEHDIKQAFMGIQKIQGVHDFQNMHVWSFTNKEVIGTLHLHISAESDKRSIGNQVTRLLSDAGIKDLTLQMEYMGNSNRFGLLAPEIIDGNYDEKNAAEKLLHKLNLRNFQLGKTKVFLRAGQIVELDARRAQALNNAAKIIQRRARAFIAHKEFIRICKAAIKIQTYCRGCLACKLLELKRREAATILIQKHTRRWLLQRAYTLLHSAVIVIQAGIRASFARKEYYVKNQTVAATKIQKQWHMYKARSYFCKLRTATIAFQCAWRCRVAARELRRLKLSARETGALQEAKNKLEKRCEELTWRLKLEKRLRAAAEESKKLEVTKLQNAFQEMQEQLSRANLNVLQEQEKTKVLQSQLEIATRELSVLERSQVKFQQLIKENEHIKASVGLIEKKQLETEREFIRTQKECEEWQRKAEEAELKASRAKQNLQRFEEKIASVDHEKQVLRQQAIVISPTSGLANVAKPVINQTTPEFRQLSNGDQRTRFDSPMPYQIFREFNHTPVESRRTRLMAEKQQENQELILKCVTENMGFSHDRPVAACIIYKCLLHWHAFEAERTSMFEHLIQAILSETEDEENCNALSYWLSNISTLLFLLQRNLRSNSFPTTPQRRLSVSISHLGRLTQSFRSPSNAASPGALASFGNHMSTQQVDAKYPALLFKQQLTAALEKVYGLIRDNVKRELTPLLNLCIQAPRVSRVSMVKGLRLPNFSGFNQQALGFHWRSIIKIVSSLLNTLCSNHVPAFFISKLFTQVFSFINVQLFNSLLLRRECCSFSNGEYVKFGLSELEQWIFEATEKYAGTSWDELRYIRQAVGFLVIHQKRNKSLDELVNDICPVLSIQQLYRISTMYWDDKYGAQSVSNEVIKKMRDIVKNDSHDMSNNSFLLDDDLSIPFSADDISNTIGEIDLSDVEPPPLLHENPTFQFLLQHSR